MSNLQERVVPLHSRHTSSLSFLVVDGTTTSEVIHHKHLTTNALTDMFTGHKSG